MARGRHAASRLRWRNADRSSRSTETQTPELGAKESGLELFGLDKEDESLPIQKAVENFLKEIKTFRKPLTHQKYEYILELFAEYTVKSDARHVTPSPGASPRA
jgi:hypothetical protein